MSRRHKENDIIDKYNTNSVESQADSNPKTGFSKIESLSRTISKETCFNVSLFSIIMDGIISSCLDNKIVVDDQWIKIPHNAFGEDALRYFRKQAYPETEEEPAKKKKGRNPIKRLFNKIADSKVVSFFHDTLDAVKEKCAELYNDMTQYCVCFLRGIHKAFAPDEDPYGKISHYHEMLKDEVWPLPSRRTIDYYNNWYENWIPIVYNELSKDKKERHKHKIWEKLIEWIYYYLQKIAPEYAVQMQKG